MEFHFTIIAKMETSTLGGEGRLWTVQGTLEVLCQENGKWQVCGPEMKLALPVPNYVWKTLAIDETYEYGDITGFGNYPQQVEGE